MPEKLRCGCCCVEKHENCNFLEFCVFSSSTAARFFFAMQNTRENIKSTLNIRTARFSFDFSCIFGSETFPIHRTFAFSLLSFLTSVADSRWARDKSQGDVTKMSAKQWASAESIKTLLAVIIILVWLWFYRKYELWLYDKWTDQDQTVVTFKVKSSLNSLISFWWSFFVVNSPI